jgi:hypothetical protein
MSDDPLLKRVWSETEYFLKCSDCEGEQERCFNPEQAVQLGRNEDWRWAGDVDGQIICPRCAPGYPETR